MSPFLLLLKNWTPIFPFPASPPAKTYQVLSTIVPFEATGKAYHDLSGRFPHKSSRGNEYLLVHYDYDSNAILAEPLKNRQSAEKKEGDKYYMTSWLKEVMPHQSILWTMRHPPN